MEIKWKKEEIKERLTKLLDKIVNLALDDDVISSDEQDIIDTLREHILSFENRFATMIDDHTETEEVMNQLTNYFERAIEATARQARQDGTITSDELILIDRLAKSLRQEDLSKYFS